MSCIRERIETYAKDEHSIYGLYRVRVNGTDQVVAAVIGIRPQDIGSARAAGSDRGYVTAWYEVPEDWAHLAHTVPGKKDWQDAAALADAILDAFRDEAWSIYCAAKEDEEP